MVQHHSVGMHHIGVSVESFACPPSQAEDFRHFEQQSLGIGEEYRTRQDLRVLELQRSKLPGP